MEEVCLNSEAAFDDSDEDRQMLGDGGGKEQEPPNPTVGLEFGSFEEAYDFYNLYGKERGFGIRVSNSWFRSKRKERYRAKLSCSSAGFKKKSEANNPRPETRTGCPAMVVIRLLDSNRWRIVEAELDHNHHVSPQTKRLYKSHRRMALNAQHPSPQPVAEVHTIKLYRTAHVDPPATTEQSRSRSDRRGLELREGDSHALYNYFCRMQLTSPGFFYLMDFAGGGQLRSVFWADPRSRADYAYFSDSVAIDTSCFANKYEVPLISFVGVNHRGAPVLLGCGLLGDDSADRFAWMLRTWLGSALGGPPRVVVTDHCAPLRAAVSEVLPNARHCYSSRHIIQRLPEKLGGLSGYDAIRAELSGAVYGSLKISEFETSWADMVRRHGLADNGWLRTMYDERHRWVPVYLKDVFSAGIIPACENEGLAPFFDGYLHKHTSPKEFVDKYDLALHRKRSAGTEPGDPARPELRTRSGFEAQASRIYTKEIFERFRSEVEGMESCSDTRRVGASGAIATYVVEERVGEGVKCFEVLYETTRADIRCICGLFNYKGYLCRHALSVLSCNGVEEIPERYVLPRWGRDFKSGYPIPPDRESGGSADASAPSEWYDRLTRLGLPVVEEGAKSREHYETALRELEALLNKLNVVDDNLSVTLE